MPNVSLPRYTVINDRGEFLKADNLLLLPAWTQDVHAMWFTTSRLEARKVADQAQATACSVQFEPLRDDPEPLKHRGIPVAVQQQIVALRAQGMSYRKIAALLHISKSTVGNILHR